MYQRQEQRRSAGFGWAGDELQRRAGVLEFCKRAVEIKIEECINAY